ncbi:uncharacterized protein METZ01_LOCUS486880 [marine metagenome]|uniref:Uncharacterized protein n=1 Tax=marine metagenome TaxID=408172 RepID=A0A383CNT0_9ZZZZ
MEKLIKKLQSLKEFIEINIITLNKTNIAWIIFGLFVIYVFTTKVLLNDLYDVARDEDGNIIGSSYQAPNN